MGTLVKAMKRPRERLRPPKKRTAAKAKAEPEPKQAPKKRPRKSS